jgi:hypothetical protein
VNSGTPESHYGYWYPGKENDGAAGGGFEPRSWATSWLRKSHPRGSWYYGCEIDLGFSGALRTAATVVADDPIFGRVAYGGLLSDSPSGMEVVPRDGLRQRLHVMRDKQAIHMLLDRDGFAANKAIQLDSALREIRFTLENRSGDGHDTLLRLPRFRGAVAVEGLPARIASVHGGMTAELMVGPAAQYPITVRLTPK